MKPLTIGSICSGTGMLDEAVMRVIDARPAWFCQYEPPDKNDKEDRWQFAARVLAHHWPEVPNHGDITKIDWASLDKADWITAGFPCQDVSLAGKRQGLVEGTRSGIWRNVAAAIAAQRAMRAQGEPGPIVFLENVRGLLSARADSDVEPCPECLGDGTTQPHLRALGAVLGDLADLGFDAEWVGLPASHVGAAHERMRIFILAWPAAEDPHSTAGDQRRLAASRQAEGGRSRPDAGQRGGTSVADSAGEQHEGTVPAGDRGGQSAQSSGNSDRAPADAPSNRRGEGRPGTAGVVRGSDAALGGGSTPAGAEGHSGRISDGDGDATANADRDTVRQQPVPGPGRGSEAVAQLDRQASADADGGRLPGYQERHLRPEARIGASCGDDTERRVLDWGPYGPAIRRWEAVLGRPAPRPTQPGRSTAGQLSAHFVEWHMGLPKGHVTAVPPAPGMTAAALRNAQLKALGGGVVWQQGARALRIMLQRAGRQVAS